MKRFQEWEQRKLNEMIINLDSGVSVNSSDENTGYYILKTSAIKSGNVDLTEVKSILREEIIRAKMPVIKGSILISRMNTPELVGASGLVLEDRENIFLPDRLWQGRVNDNFSSEWLIQSLNTTSSIRKIHDLATGTSGSMKNISKKVMLNFELKVPKLGEQQKIGAFFEQLDDAITLHQQKYGLLLRLKQAYLQLMFPQTGESTPQVRFAGFHDNWEQRKLGDITESFSGGTPTAGKSEYYGGDIPFIRSGEISSELTELFITENGLNSSSAKMVKVGDILYALYGATSGEVSISRINGAINQAILAIRPTKNDNSYLIVQWLRKQKDTIISTYLQGGQGNLSGSIVKDLVITLPQDNEEQIKIGTFFKQLDDTITLHQQKIESLKSIKEAYLQKMFV
ncbi:restriction endonuclease subunit S [Enterococcus asini]|uniref:restriction endonuclease subunit S n=1 Tax=Enterococcus asini TaxID=57732 RepID=UPI0026DD49BB|nr:restriction endonuclease subunit S [Enterococcus asini]